ncbi:MAG: gamma-glutamylcyclotransferase [Endozoicomonas sp.]
MTSLHDKQWLEERENHFKSYIPDIRAKARTHGKKVTDWGTINEQRQSFLNALPEGSDLCVFAYGSLMWNPMLRFSHQFEATLKGYQRRFCLNITFYRASREHPGLMMALDTGGHCQGLCYRIPAEFVEEETHVLWMRECPLSGYLPQWVVPETTTAPLIPTMTFVINRDSGRYQNNLSRAQTAARINTGRGSFGTNREYFDNTLEHLRGMNIFDQELEELQRILQEKSGF